MTSRLGRALALTCVVATVAVVIGALSRTQREPLPALRVDASRGGEAPSDIGAARPLPDAAEDAPRAFASDTPDVGDPDRSDIVSDDLEATSGDSDAEDVVADETDSAITDAPPSEAGSDTAMGDTDAGEEPFTVMLDTISPSDRCTLRATAQGVVATCDRRRMACSVLARGELSSEPGEELASRCDHEGGPTYLAVSTNERMLWADRTDQSSDLPGETCGDIGSIQAELVTVAGASQRALLVRVRNCSEPANYVDYDNLFWWNDGAMTAVASASFACTYEGATDGPEMNVRGTYDCHGGYLTRGPRTPDTSFTVVGCDPCRQRDLGAERLMLRRGRLLQTLVWDAESERFVERE